MKKNSKGFFLAETIVVIALVTTVMAFVYPNITKLYDNFKNKTHYYDQTRDIYTLKAVYKYLIDNNVEIINEKTKDNNQIGCKIIDKLEDAEINYDAKTLGIDKLYVISYTQRPSIKEDYNFNKYLKRFKITTNDSSSYRIIGVFKDNATKRYASIKIENPNPNRNCSFGG